MTEQWWLHIQQAQHSQMMIYKMRGKIITFSRFIRQTCFYQSFCLSISINQLNIDSYLSMKISVFLNCSRLNFKKSLSSQELSLCSHPKITTPVFPRSLNDIKLLTSLIPFPYPPTKLTYVPDCICSYFFKSIQLKSVKMIH